MVTSYLKSKQPSDSKINSGSTELRVGLKMSHPISELDTLQVRTLDQATLLRNLYSPIVDYNKSGQIVSALADDFYWNANKLVFNFGTKSKTIFGNYIGAEDAAISLKRLVIDGKNTHGDIAKILCPDGKINNLNDECDGIRVIGNQLELTPSSSKYNTALIELLASIDFRVIPKSAVDPSTLKIINFKDTSGPYYLDDYDKNGLTLKANPNNYLYHPQIPKLVKVIYMNFEDLDQSFLDGKIDLIPTVAPISKSQYEKIVKSGVEFEEFQTYKIKIEALKFTKRGLLSLTPEERFYIGNKFSDLIVKNLSPLNAEKTTQYFQEFAEGYLSNKQLQIIEELRRNFSNDLNSKKYHVMIRKASYEKFKYFFDKNSEFSPVFSEKIKNQNDYENLSDFTFLYMDVSFNATISLLSYSMKTGTWGLSEKDRNDWLEKYLDVDNEEERLRLLNELHFNALKNCSIYPISASPYVAIARKPWKPDFNKYFAATNLWQIYRE